ncbi:MAG: hypothetical protein R3353_01800, partial [Salegentibacter mishustinae]|nr:hypothetical protein [Salegentibacter mishustinae]
MRILFFFLSWLSFLQLQSQTSFQEVVINPLTENSITREKIFLHTNKVSYLPGDSIWFTAYVGDKNNRPSNQTTVLYVNLLDGEGRKLEGKKILIDQGIGSGNFDLKDHLSSSYYYIQAYTQNSLNFGSDFIFIKQIEVRDQIKFESKSFQEHYNIQIYPEGGYAVENTSGFLIFKVTTSSSPVKFSGTILDEKNRQIKKISSHNPGIGKSSLFYGEGKKYWARLKMNDSIIMVKIPEPREMGISLQVDNSSNVNLKVNLKTNSKTIFENRNTSVSYALMYHQRNKIYGFIEFKSLDSLKGSLIIKKNIFSDGVNSITLFRNNEPIADRKFFISRKDKKVSIDLRKVSSSRDSIRYKIKLENRSQPVQADLSVSILSKEYTDSRYKEKIKNSFLLQSYLNKEKFSRYYNQIIEDKKVLDLFLMTEEFAGYSLTEMITKLNPRPKYNPEQGISLKGRVEGKMPTKILGLISNKSRLIDKTILNGKRKFHLDRLLLFNGDTVRFSFLDKNNRSFKPEKIVIDTLERYSPRFKPPKIFEDSNFSSDTIDSCRWRTNGVTQLNQVNLTGIKRSERYLRRQKLFKKYKPLVWDIGKYYDLILPDQFEGFKDDLMSFLRFEENVELVSSKNNEYYLKVPIGKEAVLYIDGERVKSHELGSINLDMNNVENIMVQPVGRGNKIYQIFTTENYKNGIEELFVEHIVTQGYDRPDKYTSPVGTFQSFNSAKSMEIDWKSR